MLPKQLREARRSISGEILKITPPVATAKNPNMPKNISVQTEPGVRLFLPPLHREWRQEQRIQTQHLLPPRAPLWVPIRDPILSFSHCSPISGFGNPPRAVGSRTQPWSFFSQAQPRFLAAAWSSSPFKREFQNSECQKTPTTSQVCDLRAREPSRAPKAGILGAGLCFSQPSPALVRWQPPTKPLEPLWKGIKGKTAARARPGSSS